jgi:hypothetical protein
MKKPICQCGHAKRHHYNYFEKHQFICVYLRQKDVMCPCNKYRPRRRI